MSTHTRGAALQGPDFCRECSDAIGEQVSWPCARVRQWSDTERVACLGCDKQRSPSVDACPSCPMRSWRAVDAIPKPSVAGRMTEEQIEVLREALADAWDAGFRQRVTRGNIPRNPYREAVERSERLHQPLSNHPALAGSIADFLSARIEAMAQDAAEHYDPGVRQYVLAECEAKQELIGLHCDSAEYPGAHSYCSTCTSSDGLDDPGWPCPTLRLLALPYADHPDYREDWKP